MTQRQEARPRGCDLARSIGMQPLTPSQIAYAQRRLAEIRAAISARLSSVTADMTRSAFNELLDKMALLQLNGEAREASASIGMDRSIMAADLRGSVSPEPDASTPSTPPNDDPPRTIPPESSAPDRSARLRLNSLYAIPGRASRVPC